ncbi:hypothetical protein AAG570_012011 [Ranatra chinensis]|uniref:Uncharacterized protein n=1 Tax=Ranatra chinensis TaxID=642074 RepID=A0ABD0YHJ4_9HEMI
MTRSRRRRKLGSSSGLQRTATPSSESLSDLLTDSFFDDDSEDFSVGSTSLDSITAQTVIEWFFNHLKGLAETHPLKTSGEVVPKCVARFLDMTPEEVTALQERLKESLRGEGRPSAQHPPPFATHVDSWELVRAYSTEEEDGTRIKSPEAQRPRKSALRTNKKQQKKKCSFLIAKEELEGNKKDSATQTEPLTLEELQVVKEAQMVAAVIENSKISF